MIYRNLAVALACGLLLGIERGWTQRGEAAGSRVAGFRTFGLLGALGGFVGLVAKIYHPLLAVVLLGGAVTLLVIGHASVAIKTSTVSATMLVAELLTLCFGMLAMSGYPAVAIASAAIATLLLSMRTELHGLLKKLGEKDVKALARFAIITAAILPFLPNRSMGPFGAWNPQRLWMVVVLVTGFSFAGYAANRIFGARLGTLSTAIIGGAYSSTAVTVSLSQRLRTETSGRKTLAAGIALASAMMFVRVSVLTAVVAGYAVLPLALAIGPAAMVSIGVALFLLRDRDQGPADVRVVASNPIAILPAMGFLLLVAAMALGARWAESVLGTAGTTALIIAVGMFDVDAAVITVGGLTPGAISPEIAGLVLATAVFANMIVKTSVVALYAGLAAGRSALIALLAVSATLAAVGGFWIMAGTR